QNAKKDGEKDRREFFFLLIFADSPRPEAYCSTMLFVAEQLISNRQPCLSQGKLKAEGSNVTGQYDIQHRTAFLPLRRKASSFSIFASSLKRLLTGAA
ncbi:MAG: hypothetical protein FWH34_07695, partial [Desulfovibrionaceae bacterium]|nr:hypothetical protein [Desulfovibrionaceae bacterium]